MQTLSAHRSRDHHPRHREHPWIASRAPNCDTHDILSTDNAGHSACGVKVAHCTEPSHRGPT
jgi:hypothetical protein